MMLYRNGNFKLAFSKETETQLDKLRQEFMADDTEAGMIQSWPVSYTHLVVEII